MVKVLTDLAQKTSEYMQKQAAEGGENKCHPSEEQFMAEMNAAVVRDAERYYRSMMDEDEIGWNIR